MRDPQRLLEPSQQPIEADPYRRAGPGGRLARRILHRPGTVNKRTNDVPDRRRLLGLAHEAVELVFVRARHDRPPDIRVRLFVLAPVFPLVHGRYIDRIGRPGRTRREEQRVGIQVIGQNPIHGRQVIQRGKIPRQQAGGEVPKFQIHGGKLDVDLHVIAGRQHIPFVREHRTDLVEFNRAKLVDPLTDHGRRKYALAQSLVEGLMHAGVEQQTPTMDQRLPGVSRRELFRVRPGQEDDLFRQVGVRCQVQFSRINDLQEALTRDHVSLAMRNPQRPAGQLTILLDDPAEESWQDQ